MEPVPRFARCRFFPLRRPHEGLFPACDLRVRSAILITMARKKKLILTEPLRNRLKTIKVRLDARTVITIGNIKALEFWKQRYPLAEVIA
jgi:hypothetical protein